MSEISFLIGFGSLIVLILIVVVIAVASSVAGATAGIVDDQEE